MASAHNNLGGNNWGNLYDQDSRATPLLTQLCEGLVKIISNLNPGPDTGLTPQRLSTYYRSVGGDDYLFREIGHPGLSLLYRTWGCFHSLQPTANAYDPPSVPCLLPGGFVRWQTLQLLLDPDKHAPCLQRAVELYDVPRPDGGIFPKIIPRGSFPARPDEKMVKWHNMVLEKLGEVPNRLKYSPYTSPFEVPDRGEGYFPQSNPHMRRTPRPTRTDGHDSNRHSASSRRRSSVPTIPSPIEPYEHSDTHHWSSDQAFSAPNSAIPPSPRHRTSNSATSHRPSSQSYHRASNSHHSNPPHVANTSTYAKVLNFNFENLHVPFLSSSLGSKKRREKSSASAAKDRPRPRSEAVSTGSEASSEDSLPRMRKHERDRRRSSLAPPTDFNRSQRRHSHDASYLQSPKYMPTIPAQPPRIPNSQSYNQHTYVPQTAPMPGLFREDLFSGDQGPSSAPASPIGAPTNPKLRIIEPTPRDYIDGRGRERRYNSGGETIQERRAFSAGRRSPRSGESVNGHSSAMDHDDRPGMRREGRPLRVNTFGSSGSGRRVGDPDVRSAGMPSLRRMANMGLSGGGRR